MQWPQKLLISLWRWFCFQILGKQTQVGHGRQYGGRVRNMTLAPGTDLTADDFAIEDISTGVHASGFGALGDGRSFSFHVEDRQFLVVEVYRPRLSGPVPQDEDIVAIATRSLTDIDVTDERSVAAAVRDAVAGAEPVRTAR